MQRNSAETLSRFVETRAKYGRVDFLWIWILEGKEKIGSCRNIKATDRRAEDTLNQKDHLEQISHWTMC